MSEPDKKTKDQIQDDRLNDHWDKIEKLEKWIEAFKEGEKEINKLKEQIGKLVYWSMDINTNREVLRELITLEGNYHTDVIPSIEVYTNTLTKMLEKLDNTEKKEKLPEPKTEPENLKAFMEAYSDGYNASKKELIEDLLEKIDIWLQTDDEDGIKFVINLRDEYQGMLND